MEVRMTPQSGVQISARFNRTRMMRIERIGAGLFGFIADDPRPSASSAFY